MRIAVAGGTGVAGRWVVEAATAGGHDVVVLSRSHGVDLVTGLGLRKALEGVDVVVDTANTPTRKRDQATAFFSTVARRLQEAASAQGATRMVLLSIIGTDQVPYGYYQAKVAHENAALQGPLPVSIIRAAQFHEMAGLLAKRTRLGPVALAPRMVIQPIAAREVGHVLAEVATAPQAPARVDIAGPEREYMPDMVQALLQRLGARVLVLPFSLRGDAGQAAQGGALLPAPEARLLGPSFAEWLEEPGSEVGQPAGSGPGRRGQP